jgi:hypothetical protein
MLCDFLNPHSRAFAGSGIYCRATNLIDSMNLSFRLGMAHLEAQQVQNVEVFNALVDQYNSWIRRYLGEDKYLFMPKTVTASCAPLSGPSSSEISPNLAGITRRGISNSGLFKFGK